MKKFKPMLAAIAPDLNKLVFPVIVSPKLDGVRAVIRNGKFYSRSNKILPNMWIHHYAEQNPELEGVDGELIVGNPYAPNVFQVTSSCVMTQLGTPNVVFYAFDKVTDDETRYSERLRILETLLIEKDHRPVVKLHEYRYILTLEDLLQYERSCLEMGFEGIITRSPNAPYKYGRSTQKEQYLIKIKRFVDSEAYIIGFEEELHNNNKIVINELGLSSRSSSKEGLVGKNMLGALRVRDCKTNIEFSIGSGFTKEDRFYIWGNKEAFKKAIVKYKYFPIGIKEAPRFPVFLGVRDKIDL